MRLYKYQGAGNDFLIADNRDGHISERDGVLDVCNPDGSVSRRVISDLCDRKYGIGADGLMLLDSSDEYSFGMRYFNSDGSGGMMCGNGGRCIAAFAADMGLNSFVFIAPDGKHVAEVGESERGLRIVRLQMIDADMPVFHEHLENVSVPSDGWFVNTGTNHFVRIVDDVDSYDIVREGREIRYSKEFAPVGTNVNFIELTGTGIKVRTYEKGVEDETNACGTGVVASALSAFVSGRGVYSENDGRITFDVRTRKDRLSVDFRLSGSDSGAFESVWLTGPACFVAEILLPDM